MRRSDKFFVNLSLALAGLAVASTAAVAKTTVESKRDGRTFVTAPGTKVAVLPKRSGTKVRVQAPSSDVMVDTAAGHVRIRVPYFSGDINW